MSYRLPKAAPYQYVYRLGLDIDKLTIHQESTLPSSPALPENFDVGGTRPFLRWDQGSLARSL